MNSFAFKYGKVEIAANLPSGDWLLPSIKFLPLRNTYGSWPASGEIDLLEARGNRDLIKNGVNIGNDQITSSLHFGPYSNADAWQITSFTRNSNEKGKSFASAFHRYQMEWTSDKITFSVDDIVIRLPFSSFLFHYFYSFIHFQLSMKLIFSSYSIHLLYNIHFFFYRKLEQLKLKVDFGKKENSRQNIQEPTILGLVHLKWHHSIKSFSYQLASQLVAIHIISQMILQMETVINHGTIIHQQLLKTFGMQKTIGCQRGK